MVKLFLDDIRQPPTPDFVVVRSFNEAVNYILDNDFPDFISFDNDLGGKLEGKDFAQWLIDLDLEGTIDIPSTFTFSVHSWNIVAAPYIKNLLTQYLEKKRNGNV